MSMGFISALDNGVPDIAMTPLNRRAFYMMALYNKKR
jgi:hypothetical protein